MATITVKELYDILTAGNISSADYSIKATDTDGVIQSVITSDNTIKYMLKKYATRRYNIIKGRVVNDDESQSDFNESFRLWIANRQHNIDKQYQALFDYDYSPIENVDRYETETIDTDTTTQYGKGESRSGTDTETHGGTDTETHGGTDTETHGGADTTNEETTDELKKTGTIKETHTLGETTELSKAGFNSPNSYTKAEKTTHDIDTDSKTTTNNTTDTDTISKDITNTYGETISNRYGETISNLHGETINSTHSDNLSTSGTDRGTEDTSRTLRVHGNIGVTSNVTLIKQEVLELRILSLAEMLIDNFINDYTFYS